MLFFPKTKNFFSQNDSVHCELNSICTFPSKQYLGAGALALASGFFFFSNL